MCEITINRITLVYKISRGIIYFLHGINEINCNDAKKACKLEACKFLECANNKKMLLLITWHYHLSIRNLF